MLKRILLTVFSLFVLNTSIVSAQGTAPTPTPGADADNNGYVDNPYSYNITTDEYASYKKATQNCETPSLECLVKYTTRFAAMEWALDIAYGQKIADNGRSGGVFAGVMGLVNEMYKNPAAHTATYVADVMHTAGFAPKAYAQGLGFASLDPILNLWKVFRNVAYFFFIIIFIFLGFMIMLRKKISGQAAVTAQQAIPSVIISLILVTFSYAIAGFMIDLMYVLMFLIVGVFEGITSSIEVAGQQMTGATLVNLNFIGLFAFLFKANTDAQAIGTNINISSSIIEAAADSSNVATYLGGVIGGLTLTLIITVAVLIGSVRLFFELLKSYASIIMYVVTSPLVLMFGALPGNDVFGKWIKGIIGNLLAFPTVLLVLIIFIEFTHQGGSAGGATAGFMPPFLIGNGSAANMIGPLLGLAIILGLPDIVKEVKKAAGAGEGGIGSMLAGFATSNLKSGIRYSPITGRAAGYIGGAGEGIARAAYNGDFLTRPGVAWDKIKGYAGVRGGQGADFGKRFASGAEQVFENKWMDPNAWENVILSQGREKKAAEIKARLEKLDKLGRTPGRRS
jgi:hypothetical protein